MSAWLSARAQEKTQLRPEHGYPDESTPNYHRIASFAAKPDRVLIYRSHMLHSGVINRPGLLSADPLSGRLTANFFLDFKPA